MDARLAAKKLAFLPRLRSETFTLVLSIQNGSILPLEDPSAHIKTDGKPTKAYGRGRGNHEKNLSESLYLLEVSPVRGRRSISFSRAYSSSRDLARFFNPGDAPTYAFGLVGMP